MDTVPVDLRPMVILSHEHVYTCVWQVTIETREENLSSLVKTDLHC